MKPTIVTLTLASSVLWTPWVEAHHSYAMFDRSRTISVAGVIAKFEWTNPHTYLWFYAPKDGGGYQLVGLEGGGPAELVRKGWTQNSFKVGEKLTIEYNPLRDGRPGGSFVSATHADGSITQGEGGPGGPDAPPSPATSEKSP